TNIEKKNIPSKYIRIKNYKDLLNKKNLDGIIIATPASEHYKVASELVKKNINVLLEKPLVLNMRDAKKLINLVNKSNAIFMPGHIYNYNIGISMLKTFILNIGKIDKIVCQSFSNGPIRYDVNDLWDR